MDVYTHHMELDWDLENWKRLDVTSVSGAVSVGIQAKGVLKPGIREKVKHNVVFR